MAANSLKATLPSLQSTKVPREPILRTENEGENFFFRASRGIIGATRLDVAAFGSVIALTLAAAPPLRSFRRPCRVVAKVNGNDLRLQVVLL